MTSERDFFGPGPGTLEGVRLARSAVLAAMAESSSESGYRAAAAELGEIPARYLIEVAAILACFAGRRGDLILTPGELTAIPWAMTHPDDQPDTGAST